MFSNPLKVSSLSLITPSEAGLLEITLKRELSSFTEEFSRGYSNVSEDGSCVSCLLS
ncbi:hypothetical protein IKN40_03050 [bacterium]|nr:hypothetical protein [bacterium]